MSYIKLRFKDADSVDLLMQLQYPSYALIFIATAQRVFLII